jgi:hypothetical protein
VSLAQLTGEVITDFAARKTMRPLSQALSYEMEALFGHCVHQPTKFLRSRLEDGCDEKKRNRLQAKIHATITSRLNAFYSIADRSLARLVELQHTTHQTKNVPLYRSTLVTALSLICDMERYIHNYPAAHAAAQLIRCVDPTDMDVHAKIGLLKWKDLSSTDDLAPMYHFCNQFANMSRAIPISRAHLLRSFILYVRNERDRSNATNNTSRSPRCVFSVAFVNLAWTLIDESEPLLAVLESIDDANMWRALDSCLNEPPDSLNALSRIDLSHIIGIAMFVRHRLASNDEPNIDTKLDEEHSSPRPEQRNAEIATKSFSRKVDERALLADRMIRCTLLALIKKATREIEAMTAAIRHRRRNRVRKRNKKGKKELQRLELHGKELHGLDLLADVYGNTKHPDALYVLSFISHFWAKYLVIHETSDIAPYKSVLDGVQSVLRAMDALVRGKKDFITLFLSVQSKVSDSQSSSKCIPALDEDIMFRDFFPAVSRHMFRRVKLQEVTLEFLIKAPQPGCVAEAIQALHGESYEARCRNIASRHLAAFSQNMTKTFKTPAMAAANSITVRKEDTLSLSLVTTIAISRQRIIRLERRLNAQAGSRIARAFSPDQMQHGNKGKISIQLPLVGQEVIFAQGEARDVAVEANCNITVHPCNAPHIEEPAATQPIARVGANARYKRRHVAAAPTRLPAFHSSTTCPSTSPAKKARPQAVLEPPLSRVVSPPNLG